MRRNNARAIVRTERRDHGSLSARPKIEFWQKVAERLRVLRAKKRATRKEVSKATGVSASKLGRLEDGEPFLTIEEAKRLADYYGVTVEGFYEGFEI